MRMSKVAAWTVLTSALACGGSPQDPDETGWQSGCGELKPTGRALMLGTTEELQLIRSRAESTPLDVQSSAPHVLTVEAVDTACRAPLGFVFTSTIPCADPAGWAIRVQTRGVGTAVLTTPGRSDVLDGMTVVVERAHDFRVKRKGEVLTQLVLQVDECTGLQVEALGVSGVVLEASQGIEVASEDLRIAGHRPWLGDLCGWRPGATTLTVTASGAETKLPLVVVPPP